MSAETKKPNSDKRPLSSLAVTAFICAMIGFIGPWVLLVFSWPRPSRIVYKAWTLYDILLPCCQVIVWGVFPLFAIILGIYAYRTLRKKTGRYRGVFLARLASDSFVYIPVSLFLVITAAPNFMEFATRMKTNASLRRMVDVGIAIDNYYDDRGFHPPCSADPRFSILGSAETFSFQNSFIGQPKPTLTTPVPYLPTYGPDPFDRKRPESRTYAYYHPEDSASSHYILISRGANGEFDLTSASLQMAFSQNSPRMDVLELHSYDPTNGTISAGDLWVLSAGDVFRCSRPIAKEFVWGQVRGN